MTNFDKVICNNVNGWRIMIYSGVIPETWEGKPIDAYLSNDEGDIHVPIYFSFQLADMIYICEKYSKINNLHQALVNEMIVEGMVGPVLERDDCIDN